MARVGRQHQQLEPAARSARYRGISDVAINLSGTGGFLRVNEQARSPKALS